MNIDKCRGVVYIAGKMSNLPDLGRAKFAAAAKEMRDKGFSVLNPAELPDGMPVTRYMPICLAMVQSADTVYMLDNWKDSNGARIELQYARYQGKNIVFQEAENEIHA